MIKLTDIQRSLLTAACRREDGSLLPPPESLATSMPRVRRAITQLISMELATEAGTTTEATLWRSEGNRKIGVAVTPAARAAVGAAFSTASSAAEQESTFAPRAGSKQALVVELLQRDSGASLSDIAEATGWLPHTTRAALSALRKRGLSITRQTIEGATHYCASPVR